MPTIFEKDAADYACPYRNFEPCLGGKCMAWQWNGPRADRCETDNLTETEEGLRPVGSPPKPEGDGWEMDGGPTSKGYHRSEKDKLPKATAQRWIKPRTVVDGGCARHEGDRSYGR